MTDETHWEKSDNKAKKKWSYKYRSSFPLNTKRWLLSRVGRPWDKVYSEYVKKMGNEENLHSLDWLVEKNVHNKVVAIINDIWYQLLLTEKKNKNGSWGINYINLDYDVFIGTNIPRRSLCKLLYGSSEYYCYSKKQLNKTELKQLGIK